MKKISLGGKWRMTGGGFDVTGNIPGSLYSILLENGLMEDPYWRDNELRALELSNEDHAFEYSFTLEKGNNPYLLCFDGVDTLADIYLNGKHIAYVDDMHIAYEFDVTDVLKNGENTVRVECHEIRSYLDERNEKHPLVRSPHVLFGYAHIRKAHCMLGWDWGPMLPDMGIWRPVYLLEKDSARITEFNVLQRHEGGKVFVTPIVKTDRDAPVTVTVTDPDGLMYEITANEESEIEGAQLWWPRGLGEQPLYKFEAESEGDARKLRIGLRTLKLIREKDKWGEGFCHECNGVRFFAMGADYVPEDNIFSRITEERTRRLLTHCKNANFNAIRVWGGGYYPDDFFFDICDELGIVVFMDMMFACSFYFPDEKMMENIRTEVRQNVTRIRHHASLAVISGNNEIEACAHEDSPNFKEGHAIAIDIFENVIFDIVRECAPDIGYIPTSPVTCGHFIDPQNENYGDQHYWQVWHGGLPFTEYRRHFFRYLSEFGFQSFPCEKTVKQFTLPEDRNVFSRIMERHQRNASANAKIIGYLAQNYRYPSEFGTLLYASQLLQAEAIKYGVEHMRRNRGRCMGTLYWQLNDIWPVASWASIDYYDRWKALHYYAKRFYAPVLLSCLEIGETDTRPFVILDPRDHGYETKATLALTNDTASAVTCTVRARLMTSACEVLSEYEREVTVEPFSVLSLEERDFERTDVINNLYYYELLMDGKTVSEGSVIFTAPKHFDFPDPKLTYRIEGDEVIVTAEAYAKSVELMPEDADAIFEDNYFDMIKGERRIKILEGKPEKIKLRSVYDIK